MSIKEKVKRKLWAASGGYCARPDCNRDLFPFFESGEITNIEELAHIIGKKEKGPRGESDLPLTDRDNFENIVLLCPVSHRLIDKNPLLFPDNVIISWKENHEQRIKDLFSARKYDSREELRKVLVPVLSENKAIFNKYGPHSDYAESDQAAAELNWGRLALEKILPNNRKIEKLISNNLDLLSPDELEIFMEFKIHRDGFEYNKVSGDFNSTVPKFPIDFENILK